MAFRKVFVGAPRRGPAVRTSLRLGVSALLALAAGIADMRLADRAVSYRIQACLRSQFVVAAVHSSKFVAHFSRL
ncbi:hypothetical protein Scani_66730 [Streptomyces caniferus]|uniref:Uncharacterized protein n=1 Tax=Streptomyces caniferus TaxID=285557 RepID=A0A640SLR6_9ACTN|nr:hypothetical protein Scani_66730 [Streptomyces caniferus]